MPPENNSRRVTRRPSEFQFAIGGRIEFLNSHHWDAVTAEASVFMSRRYLQTAQEEFAEKIIRDYAIVYDAGEPVAAVATQSFDVVGDQLAGGKSDQKVDLVKDIKRKSLSLLSRRIMMCGNVHTWGPHGIAFAPNRDPAKLWQGVADCLYRIRRSNRLHGQVDYVIVKDLFESDQKNAVALEPFRYRSLETEPNMVLSIDQRWQSIDDYLVSLTKRYRAAAKKVLKPFASETLVVSTLEDIHAEKDRVHELYQAVASKAEVCLFELNVTTLPRMAESLGEDFVTIAIREKEALIGFVNVIRDHETAIGFYLGLDYAANDRLPIYHRLLLAVIEQAIEWECQQISFGRTALDAKSRLGCKPENTHVWVRHRVPLLNLVIQQALKNVNHAEPPQRNPFKESE